MGQFAAIASLAASVAGAQQAKAASDQQAAEMERQAELERIQATDQELLRRQRMNEALAGLTAGVGASGISFEGSPQSIAKNMVRQGDLEHLGASASTAVRVQSLRHSARFTRKQGNRARNISLLTTAADSGPKIKEAFNL